MSFNSVKINNRKNNRNSSFPKNFQIHPDKTKRRTIENSDSEQLYRKNRHMISLIKRKTNSKNTSTSFLPKDLPFLSMDEITFNNYMKTKNLSKFNHYHNVTKISKTSNSKTIYTPKLTISFSNKKVKTLFRNFYPSPPPSILSGLSTDFPSFTCAHSKNQSFPKNNTSTLPKNNKKKEKMNIKDQRIINFLSFDSKLKLYTEENGYKDRKMLKEKRAEKISDLFYDYDESNKNKIKNSFQGNGAKFLKLKILFVKGCVDYLYPKMLISKMKILQEKKENDFSYELYKIKKNEKNKELYNIKQKKAEEVAVFEKYKYNGATFDEGCKMKGNYVNIKKVLINKKIMNKYVKNYDFK